MCLAKKVKYIYKHCPVSTVTGERCSEMGLKVVKPCKTKAGYGNHQTLMMEGPPVEEEVDGVCVLRGYFV
jgi:hypothetical protein